MTEALVAVVEGAEEAEAAIAELERSGVPAEAITTYSSEPIHIHEAAEPGTTRRRDRSLIGIFAVVGGLLGGAAAILLTTWTSRRVNLVTGGQPITSPWTLGVIVFELTALGAILATLVRMVLEAGLARRVGKDVPETIADDKVVLSVSCESDRRQAVEQVLSRLGADVRP
jgi:hypothetical protein